MKIKRNIIRLLSILSLLLTWSCASFKYVPEGEAVLKSVEINQDKRIFSKNDLYTYVRQKPNKKILGLRFHMFLYNLSKPSKDNRINNYFRKIGEAPVVYDNYLKQRTKEQLRGYYEAKGYYGTKIKDTTFFNNRNAHVSFYISTKKPYRIQNITYKFEDASIQELVLSDTTNSLLKPGDILDKEVLDDERTRVESQLKELGYFSFSREHIIYNLDTVSKKYRANIEMVFQKYYDKRISRFSQNGLHKKYIINNVFIFKNYDPKEALEIGDDYFSNLDTTDYNNFYFLSKGESRIKSGILAQSVYILPGEFYNENNTMLTRRHLSSLQTFKLVNINFVELDDDNQWDNFKKLDCIIQLSPTITQSYQTEIEGTHTFGNIGGGGSFIYQHRNLFGSAENLSIRLRGSKEALFVARDSIYKGVNERGVELKLTLPKFLLPLKTENFIKKYNPKTSFTLSYNYRNLSGYYTRTLMNFGFGYNWRGNKYTSHIINPVKLNIISLRDTTSLFREVISPNREFYLSQYEPRVISVTDYSLVFTNQDLKKKRDFTYLRWNVEFAGNILYMYNKYFNRTDTVGNYKFLNTIFSQYAKTDIDFRYYNIISPTRSLVFRFFAGIAYPYKNSNTIPIEKKYFSGGANSIRAWKPGFVGPGSSGDSLKSWITGLADMKLETNLEYRFQIFRILEGAMFLDAGNVWAVNNQESRPGAVFDHKNFYKEVAVGSGIGARFLFKMFIVRLDYGLKVYDPANNNTGAEVNNLNGGVNHKWIFKKDKIKFLEDGAIHLAIAYPF